MRFQWDTITPFAREVLKKLGAVPRSDLDEAYREIGRLGNELNNIAYKNAKSFPYLIEPEMFNSYDRAMYEYRIQLKTRNMQYIIDRHMIEGLDNPEYKRFFIRHLSSRWAEQTADVLEEMMGEKW